MPRVRAQRSTVPGQPDAIEEIDEVMSRMIKDFKPLLYHLKGDQVIDHATFYNIMLSVCPFCGAANEYGMMYSGKMSKWVCLSCGSTV
jgi:transposase-like protein